MKWISCVKLRYLFNKYVILVITYIERTLVDLIKPLYNTETAEIDLNNEYDETLYTKGKTWLAANK